MYQASIRDKKKHQKFHNVRTDNYELNAMYEEYAYVKKILGNCRVQVLTNSGVDAIGIIRGTLRKFNNRVIIEAGDIVVVSKRDYQESKVDIVHKYNADQIQCLITEEKLSKILCNAYNYKPSDTLTYTTQDADNYIDFGDISDDDDSLQFKRKNPNGKYDISDEESEDDKADEDS
jgi:initiation factor 1A